MSLTDWDSRTQHVVLDPENSENPPPASPDDHIIPVKLRTNSQNKMRRTKSRGRISRELNFSKPKPKKKSICSGVNCSIQGGKRRRRTKRRRRRKSKRMHRKRRKTRRKRR